MASLMKISVMWRSVQRRSSYAYRLLCWACSFYVWV